MKKTTLVCLMVSTFILSCKHEPIEKAPVNGTTTGTTSTPLPTGSDSICFNTQILPFFTNTCGGNGCHGGSNPEKGLNLTTFSGIRSEIVPFNPTDGDIMEEINKGTMPPSGPLPQAQKNMLIKWINEGASQRNCSNTCDTINVSYSNQISAILNTNCVGCHSASAPSGGVDLSSYNQVKTNTQTGKLMCSINHQSGCSPMPKNGSKLSACQIRTFELWISNGYVQ